MNSPVKIEDFNNLRQQSISYLHDLRQIIKLQDHSGIITNDSTGLPRGFPKEVFSFTKSLQWTDEKTGRCQGDVIQFSLVTNDERSWGPVTWMVMSTKLCPRTFIGCLDMDARIYYDEHPVLQISTQFILKYMIESIRLNKKLIVTSSIEPAMGVSTGTDPWNLEVMEVRSIPENKLISELARRYITKRTCRADKCGAFIPITGPWYCKRHFQP